MSGSSFIITALCVFLLKVSYVQACLWNSAIDPVFLNTDRIEICINQPNEEVLQNYRAQVEQSAATVRSAIQSLDESSTLNFNLQPGYCDELEEPNVRPRVRIELMPPPTSTGQVILDEGFGTAQRNVLLPFLNENGGARSQENLNFLTHHEILHLLGIQHDDRNAVGTNVEKRREQMPEFLELSEEPTFDSVMNIRGHELTPLMLGQSFRDNMSAAPHDIQCIRLVYQEHHRMRLEEERGGVSVNGDFSDSSVR